MTPAEREWLRRIDAREHLLDFCAFVSPWYQRARHLEYIAPFYEAIQDGVIDRLMVLMPPRHGKTETGLRHCARYLGANPNDQLIVASYNARIAGQFGAKVRNIVASPEYQLLCDREWGTTLAPDSKARDLWHTRQGGVFLATGIGGGATGFGANGLLIDDFLKGRAEADSEVIREDIEHWYSGEAYSRLMPRDDGRPPWVIMEYTTWHEMDLGQREIDAMVNGTGDSWWVVRLPAIAESGDLLERKVGEALWPERYPLDRLRRIQDVLNRINPRDFVSLYQARPTAMEGTFYRRDHFPDIDRQRPGKRRFTIVTDWGTGGDPTAHALFGVRSDGDIDLVDVFHKACDTGEGVEALLDMIAATRSREAGLGGWVCAKGVLDRGVRPLLTLRCRQRNIPLPPVYDYAETGDKMALSGTIQGLMAAGRVRFDHTAHWFHALLMQCLAFPSGAHDEYPDVLKMMGLHAASVLTPPNVRPEMVQVRGDFPLYT